MKTLNCAMQEIGNLTDSDITALWDAFHCRGDNKQVLVVHFNKDKAARPGEIEFLREIAPQRLADSMESCLWAGADLVIFHD